MFLHVRILFVCLVTKFWEASGKQVVFMNYRILDTKEEIITKNDDIMNALKIDVVDVAVFPEMTQIGDKKKVELFAGDLDPQKNPCISSEDKYSEIIRKISCAVVMHSGALVLGAFHKKQDVIYPADVVFDKRGSVQYRNLREVQPGRKEINFKPIAFEVPAARHFTVEGSMTAYSVTSFATGFMWSTKKMINPKANLTYLVSSNWISQLPFLTAFQVYQMFAQELNLTLIVSSISNPEAGQGGVAVFHSSAGALFFEHLTDRSTKEYRYSFTDSIYPGKVDVQSETDLDKLSRSMDNFKMETDSDLKRFESIVLDRTPEIYTQLCFKHGQGNFCCQFNISMSFNTRRAGQFYTYRLVAYKGHKNYYSLFNIGGVEICGVIACKNETLSSCGQRFKNFHDVSWPVTFQTLTITARFNDYVNWKGFPPSQFPNSLLSSMRPIHQNDTNWIKNQDNHTIERIFELKKPQNRLMTFAIFARNFSMETKSSEDSNFFFGSYCRTLIVSALIRML